MQGGAEVLFTDHLLIFDCKKVKKISALKDVIKPNDDTIVFYLYNLITLLFNNNSTFGICNETHYNVF